MPDDLGGDATMAVPTVVVTPTGRLDGVATPVQPVLPGFRDRARGFRDGVALSVVLVVMAVGGGVLGVPGLTAGAVSSPSTVAVVGAASPTAHSARPSVSATPSPGPSPLVTPAVPCIPAEPGTTLEGLLGSRASGLTPGVLVTTSLPMSPSPVATIALPFVEVQSGDALVLAIGRNRCATAWRITFGTQVIQSMANPRSDPAFVQQNRFGITISTRVDREEVLSADLYFPEGSATLQWRLKVDAYPVPGVTLGTTDPAQPQAEALSTEMAPGCHFSITGTSVTGLGDTGCGPELSGVALPVLLAAPGAYAWIQPVYGTFLKRAEPGIDAVVCGRLDAAGEEFQPDSRCALRYAPGADVLGFGLPVTPGVWVVQVNGCVQTGAVQACGSWYATVDTVSPGWTPLPPNGGGFPA